MNLPIRINSLFILLCFLGLPDVNQSNSDANRKHQIFMEESHITIELCQHNPSFCEDVKYKIILEGYSCRIKEVAVATSFRQSSFDMINEKQMMVNEAFSKDIMRTNTIFSNWM